MRIDEKTKSMEENYYIYHFVPQNIYNCYLSIKNKAKKKSKPYSVLIRNNLIFILMKV